MIPATGPWGEAKARRTARGEGGARAVAVVGQTIDRELSAGLRRWFVILPDMVLVATVVRVSVVADVLHDMLDPRLR